jgi:hypothetical protein
VSYRGNGGLTQPSKVFGKGVSNSRLSDSHHIDHVTHHRRDLRVPDLDDAIGRLDIVCVGWHQTHQFFPRHHSFSPNGRTRTIKRFGSHFYGLAP